MLPLPYPVAVFDDTRVALEWLGEKTPGPLAAELSELYAEASSTPPWLASLRALLDANLRGISVATAAKRQGMSERTLQRKLSEAGTTYQTEAIDARVRAAKRLLVDGDTALTTIAMEAGCASLQHLNSLFRKRTGELPSAWRQNHRGGRSRRQAPGR